MGGRIIIRILGNFGDSIVLLLFKLVSLGI